MQKPLSGTLEDWGLRVEEPNGPMNLAPGDTLHITQPQYVVKIRVLTKKQAAAEAVEKQRQQIDRAAEALRERQAFHDAMG